MVNIWSYYGGYIVIIMMNIMVNIMNILHVDPMYILHWEYENSWNKCSTISNNVDFLNSVLIEKETNERKFARKQIKQRTLALRALKGSTLFVESLISGLWTILWKPRGKPMRYPVVINLKHFTYEPHII